MSGLISVESQLASTAQRHFQLRFGNVQARRGDGWLLLAFSPLGADSKIEVEVQSLCNVLVRDVTNSRTASVHLSGDELETQFGKLADKSVSFAKLLRDSGVSLGVDGGGKGSAAAGGLDGIPHTPGVAEMMEVLYHDVVAEQKHGALAIVNFPSLLCPHGTRCDVQVKGTICIKAFSSTTSSIVADSELEMAVDGTNVDAADGANVSEDGDAKSGENNIDEGDDGASKNGTSKPDRASPSKSAAKTLCNGAGFAEHLSLEGSILQNSYSVLKLPEGDLAKVWIDTRTWAQALALNAESAVDSALPAAWRSKAFNLAEAAEVLRRVHRTLADYWNENRAANADRVKVNTLSLLSTVSGDLREYLRSQIELYSPDWRAPWRMQLGELRMSVALCKQWNQIVAHLVKHDWVGWESGMYHDESFDMLAQRLHQVLRIRDTLASVTVLQEKIPDGLQPEVIFDGVSAVDLRTVSSATWESRVATFEHECSFMEPKLRSRVKHLFQSPVTDTELRTLQQHSALLRREGVRTAVARELDGVAAYLKEQLDRIFGRFENNSKRASTPLQKLRAARGCVAECVMVPDDAGKLFGSTSPLLTDITSHAHDLIAKATKEETATMELWCSSIELTARKVLDLQDAVVVAKVEDHNDERYAYLLTCAVHPSLRKFMQEVRNVRAWLSDAAAFEQQQQQQQGGMLGEGGRSSTGTSAGTAGTAPSSPSAAWWRLSSSTESAITACEHLVLAAMQTQQCVANHNTAVSQILPCTRAMLTSAIERSMSQVLYADTPRRTVTAANYQELEGVNLRFQNSIEALSSANRQVRRFHEEFGTQVMNLMKVDLTTHMEEWRTRVDDMRSRLDEFLATQHLSNYDEWRRHWDCQIYKALEYQYRRGLESLHEEMSEFKVELVLKQGAVNFKPSFEAIREAYYVKLREFVSVPLRFRGLQPKRQDASSAYEIYPLMPLTNNDRIVTVHTKAIELFAKLNRVRKAFRSHIVVSMCGLNGSPDLDSVVEAWMAKMDGRFDGGFRTVEEHREKMGKIEDVMKIGCFAISTVPVRASIEEHLHRLEDALLNGMRKHIQSAVNEIDDFVFRVSNLVERQPTTMDEVGEANRRYNESLEQMSVYEKKLDGVLEENKELRNHVGTSIELGATRVRWDHLKDAMTSHTKVMAAAVSKMRVSLNGLIQRFLKDEQRFGDGWKRQKSQLMRAFGEKDTKLIHKLLPAMKDQLNDLDDLDAQAKELESKCEFFGQVKPVFSVLLDTKRDATETSAMWGLYDTFEEQLEKLRNEDWLTFRSHTFQFEDFCKEWRTTLTARLAGSKAAAADEKGKSSSSKAGKQAAAENPIASYLLNMVQDWVEVAPLLKFVRGDGWMTEHWNEMFRLLDIPKGTTSTNLHFGMMLDHYQNLLAKEDELKQLHARAQGEIQLREALQDMRTWALEAFFTLTPPTESASKVRLITDWKEIMTQVSDNQALVNSLKDSPFFAHFADEAAGWEAKLVSLSLSLTLLNSIQRKWAYLEPIFARGALPHEQARFKRVDKEFVTILREVEADPRVMSLASQMDVNERLKGVLEQIERCQKSLMEYLEAKRGKQPRFYFISDEDLLEMLGHSQDPSVIQAHLKKLFMGIHSVTFSPDNKTLTHMISADHEEVALRTPVSITSNDVEDWLLALDASMQETLHTLLVSCVGQTDATTQDSVSRYPSQVLQVAQGIHFSRKVEEAITTQSLKKVLAELRQRLDALTAMTAELGAVDVLKAKALILDTIHNIEVVELLITRNVRHVEEWWWKKQLRYRMGDGKAKHRCTVHMADTTFDYTYEYQGNAAKLVHTPLTDKCYLVLTKGMDLGYGGNPYGPAGTGKTESVKALGSAMGRQVLVFNCDEGIDFKAMGRIFVGIVKCGAWGCFDEFNRLKIDQLSAISQMIQVIQQALKSGEANCLLLGKEVNVNANAGIFVTLNPAGKGYGGRTRLPDNLKQLFREVAMSVPDNELITSTMLFSEGFTHARALATNIVALYRLCGQLMSRQQHYDWGLRPLKAVLRLGGTLVQRWKKANPGKTPTQNDETGLVLQSLNTNTLSKLTADDARVFQGLLRDVFPGVESREITYDKLEAAVSSAVQLLGLQPIASQQKKVLQLYEALQQRTGVVLVGPSGSGKSTLLNILRKALQTMHVIVPLHVMNPKAMPRRRLLGYMDPDTREWYDGVLTAAARSVVKQPKEARPWILCDGDIDPEWIESLNSVLDDNKLLTMPNGVRIQFGANVNFIFETHSLEFASPATVSRMGVLFFSEKDVQLEAVVESAMKWKSLHVKNVIKPLILKYVFAAIDETQRLNDFTVPVTRMGLLRTSLLYVMNTKNVQDFIYSLARGLGACLKPESATKLARWLYSTSGQQPCSEARPFDSYWLESQNRALEFTADLSTTVTPTELLAGRAPVVQTIEVQRLVSMFQPLLDDPKCTPIFVVGPEGCGKGALLEHVFAARPSFRTATINCSAQTSSTHVVQKIEQMCVMMNSNVGPIYRPREGERLVIILKNVNLPKADRYGTVELHSFLQQLILYQGFYNQDLEWIGTDRVQIVASMNPAPSAGRYSVTPRLLALSSIIGVSYPSKTSLLQVYATYWSHLLRQTDIGQGKDYEKGTQLAQFMLRVYEKVRHQFEGEEYAHFSFCPRHLTKWVTNVLLYHIDTRTTLPAVLAYEASRIFADCLPRAEDRRQALRTFAEQLAAIGYAVPPKEDRFATMFVTWFDKDDAAAATTKNDSDTADNTAVMDGGDQADGAAASPPAVKGTRRLLKLQQKKYDDVRDEVKRVLLRYSREFKELHVPAIPDILCWVTYVDRVLARPGGHLVLVGSTGVGRRSAVLLAAYQQRREVVSLNMTQDYALKQFRLDLRGLIQRATSQNTPMVLLLEEHNIVDEAFLEYINSLLSSGEVPGLFTQEEMETMFSAIRDDAANDGHMGAIYTYFVERLQRNLRVALLMDPRHELFLIRLQSNPALISRCELLWMGSWSSEMTKTICKTALKDEIAALEASPANKGFSVHREINAMHEGMGERSTPHDVQVLINTFRAMLASKSHSSKEKMARFEVGLAKLKEAEESVEKVKEDVAYKKKDVEKMQKAADKALNEIQTSMQESQEQRDEAAALEEQLKAEQKDIATNRGKVEEELSSIKPMMEAARDAVSSIRSEQLNEIRSLPSPPEAIRVVLEGVLALLGVNDVSWQSMRQFLGERGAKQRILDFEVNNVTADIRRRVDKLLRERAAFFKPETIQRASVAAAPMAEWVKAMLEYSTIMERIAPLTQQLEQLESNQREGAAKLEHLQKKLKKIDVKVKELREGFSEKCKEAERLRAKLKAAEEELGKAKELLDKLSGEKDRWAGEVRSIGEANDSMPKRALAAAGFLTYLGQETESGRRRYLKTWCDRLNLTEVVDVTRFLRTEGELLQWKSEGLPADDLSLENAVVMLDTEQTPLIVDPASKAVEWVKEHLKAANVVVEVISMHDERFTHTLELAIRFGKTLLVTEVSTIAPLLYTVLRHDLTSAGSKRVVQVGNKAVEWQDSFRILLFSRQSAVNLSPSAAALVAEVNFSVTSLGLEGQLLGVTLQRERPELEKQKVELLKKEEGLQLELNKLEQRLLDDLADSQGSLLENTQLIKSLNEVKVQASHIEESLKMSRDLQTELDEKREVYRPFAHHGATLFFVIQDMEALNHMYQFGITDYIALFTQALTTYKGSNNAAEKVQVLVASFTKTCFHNVARGLLKKDRLVFGLHILHVLWPSAFPQDLWDALVGTITNVTAVDDSQLPPWAPVSSKIKYAGILSSSTGKLLVEKWEVRQTQKWTTVMQSPAPEQALLGEARAEQPRAAGFSDMEQLLWINTFRPDRMAAASLQIVLRKLGLPSLAPVVSLEETILGTRCSSPVLLVTSSGADPSVEIQDVANHLVGKERFVQIALGGGQTDAALQQVRRCAAQGDWLLLKNLHLVLSWASVLENELCSMPEPNSDFRLIITTEQHDLFPSVLLRMSNKVAVEAPPGVKQNVLRTYGLWDKAFLSAQTPIGARLLLGLAWFHAVVQERRTYVPQGWSKFYEFSPADLKAATDVLTTLTKQPVLDWVTLIGFLENCLYGGRLESPADEMVLQLLIRNYFNEKVLLQDQVQLFPGLTAATAGQHDNVVQLFQSKLPDVDPPALLCLCNNADRTVQEEVAHSMRESLRELGKEEHTAQTSGEQWRGRLNPVLEVWRSSGVAAVGVPPLVSSQNNGDPTPMEVFFISEVNLLGAIIKDVRAYFATLQAVADGTIIPDVELRAEATELMSGRMPSRWLDRMDGPHESKMWLALLTRKYNTTSANLKQPLSQSALYDLSALLRPQTFFNALRQHTARVSRSPLVDLVLVAAMGGVSQASVTVKIAASSLQIQGAGITPDGRLTSVQANSPSSIPLPDNITVGWVDAGKIDAAKSRATIPVYADAERQTSIFPLQIQCGSEAEIVKAALNSVACYLVNL
ncbi:putative dynein heavy chain [Leptomonas pyrrhocoris]|uniref:Cytoplasmic dynein 2 heavy chain 1 n=1 Tax=Leptomonas pyrrhocoris TaxID=157538 RepID=A0A0M9G2W6_LEPPY|nr:putative dynein heavy chain [Leptomonas pyrrhocoris]KPA81036.1 putative dynein heavy chain [Leptomonas pyrrhocoris]|eukprot:XP_015659475.1 putative dynein heavy chain [Leptomonas pyrrhocoris]